MAKVSKPVRVGVFGAARGETMVNVLSKHPEAELVAICDKSRVMLDRCSAVAEKRGSKVTGYEDFEQFLEHDMDAVVLANYATEHAPFAVRLLDSGRHVVSEVLACQTMAEAVELVEAVERSKKVYTYAENYCYFRGTIEMQRLYRRGDIGEFLHGEGEYIHDGESIMPDIAYGERDHWRNWVPSTYYCTHAIGPVLTITGTRPTRVTAYETPNVNKRRYGQRSADGSVIVCQMDNGATSVYVPCASFKREPPSIWYAIYGSKGMMETSRWGDVYNRVNIFIEGDNETPHERSYEPRFPFETELSRGIGGHGGSDFFTMHFFLEAVLGGDGSEHAIDVYRALDMTLPGMLGYKSIWEGNIPVDVPDFRDKSVCDRYRDDNWCCDPQHAGPGQPQTCSCGPVDVPDSTYEELAKTFREHTTGSN